MLNSIKVLPTKIRLSGSAAAQRNYRAQVADDLRVFLSKHEGRYIYPEDIKNFYSQRFPNLKFSVKNANPGNRAEGITIHKLNRDTLKHENCVIQVRSQSFMDRVKKIFNRDNHRHELYVDSNFADVMTHEGTHMMQYYMKPIYHNYYSTLLKLVGNDKKKLFDSVRAQDKIYDKMVYCRDLGFTPKKFRVGLNTMLDEVSENNPQQKLAHLKFMIRNAQSEQEAFELGRIQRTLFDSPDFADNENYREYATKKAKDEVDGNFGFREKINIMKEEYFKLVSQMRDANRVG